MRIAVAGSLSRIDQQKSRSTIADSGPSEVQRIKFEKNSRKLIEREIAIADQKIPIYKTHTNMVLQDEENADFYNSFQ